MEEEDVDVPLVMDYGCLVHQDYYEENQLIFKLPHVKAEQVWDQPHVVDADIICIDIAIDADKQTTIVDAMGSKKRQLKLAHRAHPLSRIIRSITSKTKQRLLQQHHGVTPRRTESLLSSGFTFSESGARFQQYGKLNHQASGWNEDRIDRLLKPRVSTEEMNLPDQPEPRLDSDYIDRHLMCLPEELRRNIRQQGVKK